MRPPTIVVIDEFINCSLQMVVTKYELVIETFVTDAPYPAFCDCIGLRRFHRCADLSDTKRYNSAIECGAKAAMPVVNQVTWWLPRYPAGFDHLLGQPLRIWMSRDPRKYEFASTVVDDKEHVKCSKPNSLNSEQITCPDLGAMLIKKLSPTG